MLYTNDDIAKELAAQLGRTDLGVTRAEKYIHGEGGTIFRLDNGQEFLVTVTRWSGPRPAIELSKQDTRFPNTWDGGYPF